LAHATAFAAVMITCNGVIGPPLLLGPLHPRVLGFRTEGAGTASRILNGVFAFVQTVRHRYYFLPLDARGEDEHATSPARRGSLTALGLLIGCLVAVVGLAKNVSPAIEDGVRAIDAPQAVVP